MSVLTPAAPFRTRDSATRVTPSRLAASVMLRYAGQSAVRIQCQRLLDVRDFRGAGGRLRLRVLRPPAADLWRPTNAVSRCERRQRIYAKPARLVPRGRARSPLRAGAHQALERPVVNRLDAAATSLAWLLKNVTPSSSNTTCRERSFGGLPFWCTLIVARRARPRIDGGYAARRGTLLTSTLREACHAS